MKSTQSQQVDRVIACPFIIGEIEIQNCFDITKLSLDQEHAEIKEFKDR